MTLDETHQMPVDTSEFDYTRTATNTDNDYIEEATIDPEEERLQLIPRGLFSTPLGSYLTIGSPIAHMLANKMTTSSGECN